MRACLSTKGILIAATLPSCQRQLQFLGLKATFVVLFQDDECQCAHRPSDCLQTHLQGASELTVQQCVQAVTLKRTSGLPGARDRSASAVVACTRSRGVVGDECDASSPSLAARCADKELENPQPRENKLENVVNAHHMLAACHATQLCSAHLMRLAQSERTSGRSFSRE